MTQREIEEMTHVAELVSERTRRDMLGLAGADALADANRLRIWLKRISVIGEWVCAGAAPYYYVGQIVDAVTAALDGKEYIPSETDEETPK